MVYSFNNRDFYVNENSSVDFSMNLVSVNDDIEIYRILIKPRDGVKPSRVHMYFKEKMIDQIGVWMPLGFRDNQIHQWFYPSSNESRFYLGSPVVATYDKNGKNSLTIAFSDSIKPIGINFSVDDLHEKDEVTYDAYLLNGDVDPFSMYEVFMRIDRRNLDFYDTLKDAGIWMDGFLEKKASLPDLAEMPLYSSWYNFHQYPTQDLLTKELKLASEMGFKTAILDDGWQFSGPTSGAYADCGPWEVAPDKFPDFKKFVDDIHNSNVKLLVWFVVPFVGINTKEFEKYSGEGKLLYINEGCRAGVLDIRYKDVREHIIEIYRNFVNKYNIDGLKLDFIDSFYATADTKPYCMEMDCETIEKAVLVLLDEIYAEMISYNPDFLFEFRQRYIGKEILNRCNMIRVWDCAYDSITNRIGIVALRLLNNHTAIHSDMLLWSKDDTPKNCAYQLLNVLFGVPQVSVLLTKIPKEQKNVIGAFVDYWTKNREILLHGNMKVKNPESNYSLISSENENKRITVLYCRRDVKIDKDNEDIFNNTCECGIFVESDKNYTYCIYDYFGNLISSGKGNKGLCKIELPSAYRCEIVR